MKIIVFILIVLICFSNSQNISITLNEICDALNNMNVYETKRSDQQFNFFIGKNELIQTLMNYCLEDVKCKTLYNQQERINETLFSYILKKTNIDEVIYSSKLQKNEIEIEKRDDYYIEKDLFDILYPLKQLMCNSSINDLLLLNQKLWLLSLYKVEDDMSILCDVNHILLIDPDSMETICVCRPGKSCSNGFADEFKIWIGIALFGLLTTFHIIKSYNKTIYEFDKMDKLLKIKGFSIPILKNAL